MERESFEDEETAEVLNKNFISIKLDREERSDIDNIYMTFCQIYTGSGGWPLSIFMTPDKKTFFAGTYFPKESRYGMPGFISLLNSITELWKEDREKVSNTGEEIIEILSRVEKRESKEIDEEKFISNAVTMLHNTFDFKYGGFGNRPKFPSPHTLMFLLRYWKTHEESNVLAMVEETLKSMYKGGIFDHIGFGFSRYSADEKWLAPHFEKMLYDNAMMAYIYCETYSATGNELYKEIAQEIFQYVLRDMTSEEGGFYSAEDADSEGVEGKFYVFTPAEIKNILGEKEGEDYCEIYDITSNGNFEGKSIPNLIETDLEQLNDEELKSSLENMRKKLFQYRDKRIHPFKDDKILTSWNGLMIAALAYGARVFKNDKYLEASEKAAEFILKNLVKDDGRLLGRKAPVTSYEELSKLL